MKLRELKKEDALLMLEWMHDDEIVRDMKTDFSKKTIDDCESFIEASITDKENLHLAIVNDEDEYMGTVSLKHIKDSTAELGITVRRCAMGKGFSRYGMETIFEFGRKRYAIKTVYWCVDPDNKRAVHFYDKNSYKRCEAPEQVVGYSDEEMERYYWYQKSIANVL